MKRSYKIPRFQSSSIESPNEVQIGETIETTIERLISNGEPTVDANIPLMYTARKDGVQPQFNIRTDKWDIALETADKISQSYQAREKNEDFPEPENTDGEDGKPEPV